MLSVGHFLGLVDSVFGLIGVSRRDLESILREAPRGLGWRCEYLLLRLWLTEVFLSHIELSLPWLGERVGRVTVALWCFKASRERAL